MLATFSDKSLTIPKATVLGVAEQIPEPPVDRINARSKTDTRSPTKLLRKRKNEALYYKLLQGTLNHWSQEERELIKSLLLKYAHVFHDDETNDFKATDIEHQILVNDDVQPIKRLSTKTPTH
jgi:hypothetical protein